LMYKVRILSKNPLFFYQNLEYSLPDTNTLIFHSYRSFMDNGLVLIAGKKVHKGKNHSIKLRKYYFCTTTGILVSQENWSKRNFVQSGLFDSF
jgi:hypothetical protein